MIRRRISSDPNAMEELHLNYGWIPGRVSIRPDPVTIEKKTNYISNMLTRYETLQDFVLHRFFGLKTALKGEWARSKMYVPENEITAARAAVLNKSNRHEFRLVPNLFSYQIPTNTNHSVIWFLLNAHEIADGTNHSTLIPDEEINTSIEEALRQLLGPDHDQFSFVWYPNPKPTIISPALFHVQVFWIR